MARKAKPAPNLLIPSAVRKQALHDTPDFLSSPASNRNLRPNRTAKKSQYFEKDSSDDDESAHESTQSGYEDENAAAVSSTSQDEGTDDDSTSETLQPPKKKHKSRGRPSKSLSSSSANRKDLWRAGVKAGLGPGTQVIIDKPRARSPGETPYRDDRIHPNTMLFLRDLRNNNDREWLKMHDPDYRTSWKDWMAFLECLTPKVSEADETIPELPLKDCIFRIYRDIRFSPDPTPYKPHFSVAWSRTGRKGPYAAYYVQIKPGGESMVGGGLWMPEAQALTRLRRDIDRTPQKIKHVLMNPDIRREFLAGAAKDERKAVKAFTKHNAETALKTKPRDYNAEHRDIELLRLRNFTMGCKLDDKEVVGPRILERTAMLVACLEPFVTYLNSVVMPDQDENEGEDGDEESDESG